MKIEVHIERLVLDGLPVTASEAPRVRAAVESELARLFATGGLNRELAAGGAVPRVDAPEVRLARRERPEAIGQGIARSVHRRIGEQV
jgi:hypothetical protein